MKTLVAAVLTGLVALALGTGIGYAVGSGGGPTGAEAADRADLACDGAVSLPDTVDDWDSGEVESQVAVGVGSVAAAAGEQDPALADLGESGGALVDAILRADDERYATALGDLRAVCEAR